MDSEKMIELLNRKIQREKQARKAAETLLEKKSNELYSAKKLVEDTLLMVQKQAENDVALLKFKSYLEALFLEYSQRLLQEKLTKGLLKRLLEDLVNIEPIQAIHLSSSLATQEHDISVFYTDKSIQFSHFSVSKHSLDWNAECTQLIVYLHQDDVQCGSLQVMFTQPPSSTWYDTIENQFGLFSEMLSAAFERQKLLEETLKEKQRAEKSEQATRDFVAMINHELRTPLNGLLGSAELMEDTVITPYQRTLLETVHQSGEMLRVIINDLLDFSKMSAGMLDLKVDNFAPSRLISTIQQIFTHQIEEKRLIFEVNVTPNLPEMLQGDVDRIQQIIVNLIGNAIKFTKEGKIILSVSWVNNALQIIVSDTGCGIPKDKQSSLFDPFSQVDNSSQRQFEGTGLGLSICQFLVSVMHGDISFSSEDGVGSDFKVVIPLNEPSIQQRSNDNEVGSSFPIEQLSILAVEDIKMNQTILKMMLAKIDVTPEFADNGQQAIDFLNKNDVDIVLMDCRMPIMDGFEATKQLRENGYNKPIIALTAGTTSMEVDLCIAAGMDDALNKPYKLKELQAMLKRWGNQLVNK
ncbi:ATP-binding protein [Aliivibrio sp. S2TY2]|uniref:ATP-binding protein n=1 Tax=unclassified Aliivibrio TaxID=2645654 RepID=UPI0023788466|nr:MULTISPECIES: ATP-binding protein [unclassified Aliivibrio]MDD9174377.1 ATP-binding protein [Aliivibrio sp. S3TY1]MDD9191455.1 ATP-binding protein [Aliivibrio sp. S2TY2]